MKHDAAGNKRAAGNQSAAGKGEKREVRERQAVSALQASLISTQASRCTSGGRYRERAEVKSGRLSVLCRLFNIRPGQ